MGVTVKGSTVASKTIENDDSVPFDLPEHGGGVPSVTLASMGTSPTTDEIKGGGSHFRLVITSGTGTPAIAANNVQVTFSRAPVKVFLANEQSAPGFYVASISSDTVNIGTKVAPAASTEYELELIVEF